MMTTERDLWWVPFRLLLLCFAMLVLVVFLLASGGCASMLTPNYSELSTAQANAASKDKSATVICTKITALNYQLDSIAIGLDQNAIKDGGVSADNSKGCVASITSAAPPKVAPVKPEPAAK